MRNIFKRDFFRIFVGFIVIYACVIGLEAARTSIWSVEGSGSLRSVDVAEVDSDGDFNLYQGDIQLGQAGSAPASATANTFPCVTIQLTNQLGTAISVNSLVIASATASGFSTAAVTSTTSVLGVAYETIAAGAVGDICVEGYAVVSTTGTVNFGDVLVSSATAGFAGADATPTTGADFGIALEEGAAAGDTVLVLLR